MGRPSPSLSLGRRRRRRWPAVLAVLMLALGGVAAASALDPAEPPEGTAAAPAEAAEAEVGEGATTGSTPDDDGAPRAEGGPADAPPASPLLARLGDLELHLPADTPVIVGYHEAATVSAIGVSPVGVLREDRNTTRTALPPDVAGATPYLVLTSRGRSAGPTSAVDVVLEPGQPVLAPVSGTVVDVRSYLLYGSHQDLRIELVPDDRPDVRVVLIHLDAAEVAIGDEVVGGVTPLAGTARLFPFGSHIDRETEPDRYPHVHIELQPVDAPRPGDEVDDGPVPTVAP